MQYRFVPRNRVRETRLRRAVFTPCPPLEFRLQRTRFTPVRIPFRPGFRRRAAPPEPNAS